MDDANWTFRILSRHFGSFDWESIIRTLQSGQGAIEVQNDQPGKTFPWHIHETDETLAILEGKIRFIWEGSEQICGPGDVICLPAGMRHSSVALDGGARYVIANYRAIP